MRACGALAPAARLRGCVRAARISVPLHRCTAATPPAALAVAAAAPRCTHRKQHAPPARAQLPPRAPSGAQHRALRTAAAATPPGDAPPLLCDDGLPLDDIDAVVVLAGGLTAEGGLPQWVKLRLDAAAAVHRARGVPVLCSGGGTPHRAPFLAAGGFVRHEGTACCAYLAAPPHALPATHLLKESGSYDTLGNAWFSLTEHALPAGWRRPLIITSAFHMPRSRAAVEWVYSLPSPPSARPAPRFLSTPDDGLEAGVVVARAAREAASLAALRDNAARVTTMREFHAWLYGTHMCYAVARQGEWGAEKPAMQDAALASY